MAIRMSMQWAGVTVDEYEAVRKLVQWETKHPAGGRLHIASFDDTGLHVTDVWDTADDFNAFVADRLMPGVAQVGIDAGQPDVRIEPLEELLIEPVDPTGGIVFEFLWSEGTLDKWNALKDRVGWVAAPPVGGIVHTAVVGEHGVHATDVWRSAADVEAFLTQRVLPAAEELGFTVESPAPTMRPLHAIFDPSGVIAG